MLHTLILAVNGTVEVVAPDGHDTCQRAALYATMAVAARIAKGGAITNVDRWVQATHGRACTSPPGDLEGQMARWARVTSGRFELLGPVADMLLLGIRRVDGVLRNCRDEIPQPIHQAAVALFGHDVKDCDMSDCEICIQARMGDWPRALRFAVGDRAEIVAAALADGYRAARRGGHVPAVTPLNDPDGGIAPGTAGSYPDSASGSDGSGAWVYPDVF